MTGQRGLTLVEVLAATVLLAVLAGVCFPLLRQSLRALDTPPEPFELIELADLADQAVADPSVLGFDERPEGRHEVPWPDHPQRPPLTVDLLAAADADHGWLAYSCGPWTVHRWVALDQAEAEAP